ncbi:MAG: TonB C-terminal domain-containing protein [Gemmatimonadota bacterium]
MRQSRTDAAPHGVGAGLTATVLVHALVLAAVAIAVRPERPGPPVYAVELVAAPLPTPEKRLAREAVERPVTPPAPAVPAKKTVPIKKAPAPRARADARTEPTPRTRSTVAPAPGETPSTGSDVANIRTPGLEFPYPEYLRNIVAEVYRRWDRPLGGAALKAEISFLILRDGSVKDIRFLTRSGSFSFDLSAQGAIEAAGRSRAFGPLPDGYPADVLPVSFFFTPRTSP